MCQLLILLAVLAVKESEVTQSCPTLCNPMDCSLPGSSIHGIFQARVLEWVAISFSRYSIIVIKKKKGQESIQIASSRLRVFSSTSIQEDSWESLGPQEDQTSQS